MKIRIIAVGKLKQDYLRAAEAEYLKRMRPYCKLEIVEVKDSSALLAAIPDPAHLVVLDERGQLRSSEEIADGFRKHQLHGGGAPLVFAIGGADGHSDAVRKRANELIAFGRITIAHRLVRLLLVEQIYRAFRIVRGEPYHK